MRWVLMVFAVASTTTTTTTALFAAPRGAALAVPRRAAVCLAAAREPPVVIIDQDYRLAHHSEEMGSEEVSSEEGSSSLGAAFFLGGLALDQVPILKRVVRLWTLGPLVTVLGLLILVQTSRLRFTFDDEAFELRTADLGETGENIVVGGKNRWAYDSFVSYDFFPKGWIDQPQGPILVYFKETQTPEEEWDVGPGKRANEGAPVRGQVHFFPALCNARQLRDQFEKNNCKRISE